MLPLRIDPIKMNIIVCVKQIQDPEIPVSKFRLDEGNKKVIPPEDIPPVINPYDEMAVELAIRIKERHGGRITVLTVGDNSAARVVKHALAMGADEGIVLQDPVFEDSDSFGTAYILSQAMRKIDDYDLILCGRQAADWDEGLVGVILAEILELPVVTLAESVDLIEGRLQVKRVMLDGSQVFSVPPPAVLTVSHETGQPRLPSGWGIISASRKEIPVWDAIAIGADKSRTGAGASRKNLIKLFIPVKERKCEMIEAETTEEAAGKLAEKMRMKGTI
jgi:electron transfer flavoprotein beta subunit